MSSSTLDFLNWLRAQGGVVTLSEIMQTTFGCEYRKHASLIRKMPGYDVRVEINRKEPGRNTYRLIYFEGNQAVML